MEDKIFDVCEKPFDVPFGECFIELCGDHGEAYVLTDRATCSGVLAGTERGLSPDDLEECYRSLFGDDATYERVGNVIYDQGTKRARSAVNALEWLTEMSPSAAKAKEELEDWLDGTEWMFSNGSLPRDVRETSLETIYEFGRMKRAADTAAMLGLGFFAGGE